MKEKPLKKIKSSVFSRSLSVARMTLQTGTQWAGHGLSNLLTKDSDKPEKWKEFLTVQAKYLSGELGELKGSLMKAGQMLSMYGEYFLPPEANQFLKSLQSQSPPIVWSEIEKWIKEELGAEKFQELEIHPQSIGSASLGQVHKAQIKKTGEWIALKVQYPGVKKAIDSDLLALRSLLSLIKVIPSGIALDQLFDEVRTMLVQETDYVQEAQQTEKFYDLLKDDPRFVVPKIQSRYCSEKLLATSLELGYPADHALVQSLSLERRNRLSKMFLELYFRELFWWGTVQTDPHLGNYRIRINKETSEDQLILFDFGAVRTYSDDFLKSYLNMITAAFKNDTESLSKEALNLKFLQNGDDPKWRKSFEEFCVMTVEPFLKRDFPHANPKFLNSLDQYDWKSSDLPQRLSRKVIEIIQSFQVRPPPREVIFLDRKTGGVFVFLAVMGARLQSYDLFNSFVEARKNSLKN
jgi:predicted unusual protein kinase regulating ubiquinone biosynthesis (AarF/ABC1/UbiB family)